MDSVRLMNYRCFEDTGPVDLKPINILLGANSSGKSSFLKFFPLLKQSNGLRLNGVFLWLGSNVDFKDFNNTVQDGKNSISIEYTINTLPVFRRFSSGKSVVKNAKVRFTVIPVNEHFDRISEIAISYQDTRIILDFTDDEDVLVIINNESSRDMKDLKIRTQRADAILPRLLFKYKSDINHGWNNVPFIYMQKMMDIANKIGGGFENRTSANIFEIIPSDITNFTKGINGISKQQVSTEVVKDLYAKTILYNINTLLDSLNIDLIRLSQSMVYVKPIRATIERYYRFQNLDMDEIDPDGSNLPMFLYNLEQDVMDTFNDWLFEYFQFRIKIKPSEGHIELLVSEGDKDYRNTVDLGFGYTQMLPILAIIWKTVFLDSDKASRKGDKALEHIVVIEQPELHLHPRFQARFARMLSILARLRNDIGFDVRFIVETHSEIILNILGEQIEDGIITTDDVNILLTEQNESGISTIKPTRFNNDGYIEDWPRNFFEDVD